MLLLRHKHRSAERGSASLQTKYMENSLFIFRKSGAITSYYCNKHVQYEENYMTETSHDILSGDLCCLKINVACRT